MVRIDSFFSSDFNSCPPYTFRCTDSLDLLCIDEVLKCDNIDDCPFGSDESIFICDESDDRGLLICLLSRK